MRGRRSQDFWGSWVNPRGPVSRDTDGDLSRARRRTLLNSVRVFENRGLTLVTGVRPPDPRPPFSPPGSPGTPTPVPLGHGPGFSG